MIDIITNMKTTKSGIYCITNKINGKKYIGCSIDIERRWSQHKSMKQNKHTSALRCALMKYGINNFDFNILLQCCKERFAFWEKFYISNKGTVSPNGYNLTYGGDANIVVSEETRQKLSESSSGKRNGFYGKRHADEFKERQRQNKLGKSTWNKGKEHTPEHKENLRLAWIRRRERMNNDKTTD